MELPPYRVPTGKSIFRHTWEKGRQYLQKMSGVILVCSLAIWALGYFPRGNYETVQEQQENSYIGMVGKSIEPVLEPLGFDWRMGVGIVSGVGAKELVVSTLGVMYSGHDAEVSGDVADSLAGADHVIATSESDVTDSSSEPLASTGYTSLSVALKKSVSPAGAMAYMVFILLYFPCVATFIAIRNETGSWKWAMITAVYTIVLAWVAAFATFHLAGLFL
jgi:ferrous iron transport protein B